ncbi:MAG TPA: DNA polymerase I [Syntrophobacteraceae bacterium]|nr:DNA polymerase I [Syntrophobacteraceae bacterium]
MATKTMFLIDGSSYCYRAFYAVRRLTNAHGMPTQAVFGFAQMLLKVLKDKKPDYICVIFDSAGPTFRHERYPEYKATRQKMPEDLAVQLPYIRDLVRLFGLSQLAVEGFEADDLIAGLTDRFRDQGLEIIVASADKDLHQLIEDPRVRQWDPQKDRVLTSKEVEERFGIKPHQMVDLLALMGDSSDHVPGIPGVGEKTAQKLMQQWGALDAILEHVEEISPSSLRDKISRNRELAVLSRELVTLCRDVPVTIQLAELIPGSPQTEALAKLYLELDFKNLLSSLQEQMAQEPGRSIDTQNKAVRKDRIITTAEGLAEVLAELRLQDEFSVDLETTSTDPMQAQIVGIALSWRDHQACYIPVGHQGRTAEIQLPQEGVLQALTPLLSGEHPNKVGQNIKYEWVVLQQYGIELRGIRFDTMVASYLLDPGKHSHRLENIAMEHLGERMISYTDVAGKGKAQVSFAAVDVLVAADYACEDAEVTWRLAPILRRKLKEGGLLELYTTLELPLVSVLARMEHRGILVDNDKLKLFAGDLGQVLDQKSEEIYRLAGESFNIKSPKQLAGILFEKLGLPVVKQTKTGPSTDIAVLETLATEHPIIEQLLSFRSLSKLLGTYVEALPRLVHLRTGRLHTSFNQTVTATGRLSSSDPNLQNIPIRSQEGRQIRAAFVAAPGHNLLAADYSQIELRILAHFSEDEHLLAAFQEDEDIHRRTAAEMLGVPPQEVTPEMRRQAKAINFGIIYGMGPFGLARTLGISNTAAKAAIERYFAHYAGVRRFIDQVIEEVGQLGYCQTLAGRRRAIPELRSRNRTIRQQGERLAINTKIQGTAADIIKKAMIDIDGQLQGNRLKSVMLLQVHDELIFEVPMAELGTMQHLVRYHMEGAWRLRVPLRVDVGWGVNWLEAHP